MMIVTPGQHKLVSLPHSEHRTHCTRHHQHQHWPSHKPFQGRGRAQYALSDYLTLPYLGGGLSIGIACSHSTANSRSLLRLMFSLHKTFLFLILTLSKDPTCQPLGGIPCVWVQTKTPPSLVLRLFLFFLLPPPPPKYLPAQP